MKETFTNFKRNNLSGKTMVFHVGLLLFSILTMMSSELAAQTCCPEFQLKDAIEVCYERACADTLDPAGQGMKGLSACKESTHVYTVYPNDPAYTYTWTVSGGTPTSFSGNPNAITWGTSDMGYIKVVISNLAFGGDCLDSITAQICLVDAPEAGFIVDQDTVCENTPVHFTNTSPGGSEYLWDFGDGTFSILSNPLDHAYSTAGTYVVTLTVTDMGDGQWQFAQGEPPVDMPVACGCSDTITRTIVVLPGEGPKIETDCCYGTVCPGETSSFCTPAGCSSYNWIVTGGSISLGADTNCIEVTWDASYSVPTTVSLETPGCSTAPCDGITTLHVPVLYPNLPIVGPTDLCPGGSGTFTLPTLPGTFYTWTVTGGSTQFNLEDRNTPSVNISFFDPGSYTVKCDYDNPLAGCSGSSTYTVDVKAKFSIYLGEERVCEGSTMPYSTNGPANWSVSPSGATIIGSGSSVNIQWNVPGNYTITATPVNPANFCNSVSVKAVEVVALPVLNTIVGTDTVCPNENNIYSISSDTEEALFTWAISVGSGAILSEMGENNDSIVARFTGSGPWQLDVYQELEIAPGISCPSLIQSLNVYPYDPPSISGLSAVCVDAEEIYTSGLSTTQEDVEWTISPAGQGSVLSGQGTNTVLIKWHGPSNTATLTVTTCTGSDSQSVTVNGPPVAIVTWDVLPVFCDNDVATLTLSTLNVPGYFYQWYKDGSAIGGEINFTYAFSTFPLNIGTHQYWVEVTHNGCTVKSNIIDVVIKNCEPGTIGGPPGPNPDCDVVAYFWTYVECAKVTLVDKSYLVGSPPPTIINYAWTATGPGTTTFSPPGNYPDPTLTVSESGTYTITLVITSSSGCTSTFITTVDVLLPNANFTMSAPACENEPITFIANPNNPDYHYEWYFGDGFTSYDAVTEHAYAAASPPNYTVILIIRDEKGCQADSLATITVNPTPNCTITASDTIFCPGSFETLTACYGLGYQWYKDDQPISGETSINFDVYEPGEYYVEVTNTVGCSSKSNEIYMYMYSLPIARISGNTRFCETPGSTIYFSLSALYDADYTYLWSSSAVGASFSPPNGVSTTVILPIPAALPVSYEFMVQVTDDSTDCVNSDTICITFFETPTLSVTPLNICEGTPITLSPTPNSPTDYTYQWNNGATTPTITVSTPGFYSLTMTDKMSGCDVTANAGFIFAKPDLSLFPLGCADICPPDSLHLYIPLPLNNWVWPNTYNDAYPFIAWYDNGDYTSAVGYGATFDFPASGTGNHEFSVVVQNYFGCIDTAGVFCLTDNDVCCEIIVEWQEATDASCAQLADGSYTILLDPASTGGPFTLTKYWPLPVQSWTITPGIPFTVSGLAAGAYGFKVTDASDECEEFFDVSIGHLQEDCCFAALDSSYIKIYSSVTYNSDVVWDNKYYIHDGVTVTIDGVMFDITNVDIVFGECAGIEFINGGYVRANNSVLRPCDIDKSWKGLRFDGAGEFDNIVNESTFKNAEVALYFKNGADAVVSNNLFSNCNNGLRVENHNRFNHPISGNRFVSDDFFPNFACTTKYPFVNNSSTYGIFASSSRFLNQISHNEFINTKGSGYPITYGIYHLRSGGVFSENTFTDIGTAVYVYGQLYYTSIQNNEIEVNTMLSGNTTSIYALLCQGPVIEILNNEISNNYNQYTSFSAIYSYASNNVNISGNLVDGFNYGIIDIYSLNHQISNNVVENARFYGIYVYEMPNSLGYITCNSVKMKDFNSSIGLVAFNMPPQSEVSSNCITDCRTSIIFFGTASGANLPVLPVIRNNFLYNYNYTGISVHNYSGNIGTVSSPGLNTLWSNNNSATDINSNTSITVADNFGMFNISFPQVQITSNNPYHSTASCGHQIFNMPSQGNLNINYLCDNSARILNPMMGAGGNYLLAPDYKESLKSSLTPYQHASMIMASVEDPDADLLATVFENSDLSQNEKALLEYDFHYRKADFTNAQASLEMFISPDHEELNFKNLALYDLTVIDKGWEALTAQEVENMKSIVDEESKYSNFAIALLNNVSGYRDYILEEPAYADVLKTDNIKHIENGGSYLNIYPNPVQNTAFIELLNNTDGSSKIEVFDVNGKLISEYSVQLVSGGIELDVANLQNGIYFVTLTNSESGFMQKGKLVKVDNQQ